MCFLDHFVSYSSPSRKLSAGVGGQPWGQPPGCPHQGLATLPSETRRFDHPQLSGKNSVQTASFLELITETDAPFMWLSVAAFKVRNGSCMGEHGGFPWAVAETAPKMCHNGRLGLPTECVAGSARKLALIGGIDSQLHGAVSAAGALHERVCVRRGPASRTTLGFPREPDPEICPNLRL